MERKTIIFSIILIECAVFKSSGVGDKGQNKTSLIIVIKWEIDHEKLQNESLYGKIEALSSYSDERVRLSRLGIDDENVAKKERKNCKD